MMRDTCSLDKCFRKILNKVLKLLTSQYSVWYCIRGCKTVPKTVGVGCMTCVLRKNIAYRGKEFYMISFTSRFMSGFSIKERFFIS